MKKNSFRVRLLVMLAVLVFAAIGYFTAFGLGDICGIGFGDITLICPLGALLAMISQRSAIPMAIISVLAVLAVCIVLGKVFCSWICPVHFLSRLRGDKKGKKETDSMAEEKTSDGEQGISLKASGCAACAHPCGKSKGMKIDSRHGILAAALASTAIFGFPVFCLICPVGLTFATVLLVMRLFAFGETTWTIVAFVAIIAVELFLLPRWCKRFCPLGALMSLFSGLNRTFRPTIDAGKCIEESQGGTCGACVRVCPEGIDLHDTALGETTLNDCSKCRACSDVCPTGAITFPLLAPKRTTTPSIDMPAAQNESSSAAKEGGDLQ